MTTFKRTARLAAVCVTLTLVVAACGSSSDGAKGKTTTTKAGDTTETTAATDTPAVAPDKNGGRKTAADSLVVGAVLPQSGNLAQLGPPMIAGAKMAERDINAAGGVNGKPMKLIVKDDGGAGDDDLAVTSVNQLINNDKVAAIVGAAASGTTKTIIDRVTSSGTVECSPSNTGSDLTTWADKGLYFRTPPPDNLQALALAKAISDDGHQNVAVIAQNTDYGTGFVKFLKPALTDSGAKITADVTYDEKGTGIDAEVEKVISSNPDAVALIGYPEDGGKVVAEMTKKGFPPTKLPIYVTDGMQSNELYKAIDANNKASSEGIKGTAASAAPEGGASFFPAAFKAFAPQVESPIYSAQSYDCTILIALAAEKSKSNAPFDIAKNMIDVSKGTTPDAPKCDTYEKCVTLLRDGKDINYEGASGALDFTKYGEPSAGDYEVYTYGADGSYKTDSHVMVGK